MGQFSMKLSPSLSALTKTMTLLIALNGVIELRALDVTEDGSTYPRTVLGYYTNSEEAAKAALHINRRGGNLYVLLNSPNPALLARANNRTKVARSGDTTSDADIQRRSLILIDCDPARPAGVSATDEEKAAAVTKAREIQTWLRQELGIVTALADSGNGAHVLIRVDLPNTGESTALVKQVLEALDARFSDAVVHVDTKVYNASRITKAYGVVARKGDSTPDRPHRVSDLLDVPEPFEPVPEEKLRQIAATLPQEDPAQAEPQHRTTTATEVRDWLERYGLSVQFEKDWQNGKLYELESCPFNNEHRRSFHVIQWAKGNISAGCFHNSCKGNGWPQLRDLKEPGWRKQVGEGLLSEMQRIIATGDANAIFDAAGLAAQLNEADYGKIKSVLPKAVPKREFDRAVAAARAEKPREGPQKTTTGLVIPDGYRITEAATIQRRRAPNGNEYDHVIAHSPLTISARLSDAEENLQHFRVEYKWAGRPKIEVIERATALDARKLIGMAATGFPVATDNVGDVATYLHHLEAANDAVLPC
jgi:hypothetical protein